MSDKPKRPLSGYMQWTVNEGRPTLKDEHPEGFPKGFQQMKRLGEMWGELEDQDKEKYNDDAVKLMAQWKLVFLI